MSLISKKMQQEPKTRRRGGALESALLDAAWLELAETGYKDFTMEGIARRAGTNRSVLLRRWPTRQELAFAAIKHFVERNPITVSDIGDTRAEILSYLKQGANRAVPMLNLLMLRMSEYFSDSGSSFAQMRETLFDHDVELLRELLHRGVERGDLDVRKLTPRIVAVLPDLIRNEIFSTLAPVPDAVIAGIVDEVFLPLARLHSND